MPIDASAPTTIHVPVLPAEVLHWLAPRAGQTLVDGTLGGGGHTRLLAEHVGAGGLVLALDRDPAALLRAESSLAGLPVKIAQANFTELPELLKQLDIPFVDGVLLDLGLSSDQLADRERGFSYEAAGPLDLRFDTTTGTPAWRMLERIGERELADLIYEFGEERFSRRIARRVVERRKEQPIHTAAQMADLVRGCVPRSKNHDIDPATRTFQALRIAVNDELASLDEALRVLPNVLRPGGRLAIISFHSLEDRRVKQAFRDDPRLLPLTKKPIGPNQSEVDQNARSRSARLRVAERVT